MNKKGQAALEYLMTYGWALIVIAIVVGVLIFIVSTPTSGITCNSSTTEILYRTQDISAGDDGVGIQLQNAAGGDIVVTACAASGSFDDTELACTVGGAVPSGTNIIISGARMDIALVDNEVASGGSLAGGTKVTLTYTDPFGITGKTADIACQGVVP